MRHVLKIAASNMTEQPFLDELNDTQANLLEHGFLFKLSQTARKTTMLGNVFVEARIVVKTHQSFFNGEMSPRILLKLGHREIDDRPVLVCCHDGLKTLENIE